MRQGRLNERKGKERYCESGISRRARPGTNIRFQTPSCDSQRDSNPYEARNRSLLPRFDARKARVRRTTFTEDLRAHVARLHDRSPSIRQILGPLLATFSRKESCSLARYDPIHRDCSITLLFLERNLQSRGNNHTRRLTFDRLLPQARRWPRAVASEVFVTRQEPEVCSLSEGLNKSLCLEAVNRKNSRNNERRDTCRANDRTPFTLFALSLLGKNSRIVELSNKLQKPLTLLSSSRCSVDSYFPSRVR